MENDIIVIGVSLVVAGLIGLANAIFRFSTYASGKKSLLFGLTYIVIGGILVLVSVR